MSDKKEKPTLDDLIKYIKGTGLDTKKTKQGNTAIKYDRILCYAKETKYGLSIWLTKDQKTLAVKTETQLEKFSEKLIKYVNDKKTEQKPKTKAKKKQSEVA